MFAGLTREEAAKLLGVSLRTVGHWETGKARPAFAAFKLLRIYRHGDLCHPEWSAYAIVRGRLVTPEGHAFAPWDLTWLSLLIRRSEAFSDLLRQRDSWTASETDSKPQAWPAAAVAHVGEGVSSWGRGIVFRPMHAGAGRSIGGVNGPPFVTVSGQYPPLPVGDDSPFIGRDYAHPQNDAPSSNTGLIAGGSL